ncbi:MAG: hypothetical protein JJ975_12935 [Bacteroidia bacterium]|nr:hypothetical protein [Bacteroidia bacterium]
MKTQTIKTQLITHFLVFIALGPLLVFQSCKRDSDTIEGPSLNDLYGDFAVLETLKVNQPEVDFSTGETVFFSARFSKLTDWTLTIKSNSTSAVKIIQGKSRTIDQSSGLWDGSTTQFPSFGTGSCTAVLTVEADSSFSDSVSVSVTGSRVVEGRLVADFENGINPDWNLFVQSGANMSFTIENSEVVPHGANYFDMAGEVNWDYLIGLIDFPATAYGANGFDLPSNPSDLYFNVVLYRPDTLTNGIVLFQFKEDDNDDGNFTEANEDMYSLELKNLDAGWQIVSMKYSDMIALVNGSPSSPNGNGQHNPDKLHTLSCLFLANPATGYSKALMDFVIFTEGNPLSL